jgi:transglutaminase-like putative cysteine protease
MIYDVRHRTLIRYEQLVTEAHHVLHLIPRNFARQRRIAATLTVEPEPSQLTVNEDYFGNVTHHLTIQEPHQELHIESNSRVEVQAPVPAINRGESPSWEGQAAALASGEGKAIGAQQFIYASPQIFATPAIRDYARASFKPHRPVLEVAMDVTERIFDEFEYQGGVSDVSTPVARVLEMRKGVCQDFAHLAIAAMRSFGIAARYVSGYLLTRPAPGQPKLVGADASHAWFSVWAPDQGWVDFDPTNGLMPREEHVTAGWGRDYSDVSPTNGFIVGGGAHEVSVGVDVSPVAVAAAAPATPAAPAAAAPPAAPAA